jgi:hypothetical protein
MESVVKRWVSYGGLLFVALVVVAVFVAPNPAGSNATAAKVLSNYHRHQGAYYVSAYLIVAAVIVGLAYFWYLREYLTKVPANRRLMTIAYAGAVVFGVSGTVGAGLNFALADASHRANVTGVTMQTLNILNNDLSVTIAAAGTAAFLLATGLAIVRNGGLPRWLGWVALVFGVISASGIVGPVGVGLWVLAASITVLVRRDEDVVNLTADPAPAAVPAGD